jgi:mannose-6-phosphate isomerase-like protein (cupin superfamily)
MIRRHDEMRIEIKDKMRGGDGAARLKHLFSEEELGSNSRLIAHVTLFPGDSVGAHPHTGEREVYYILSGQALFTENSVDTLLNPGDSTITGGGDTHAMACAGETPLEFLAVIIRD